jgi:protein-tyrosine-phosphatase
LLKKPKVNDFQLSERNININSTNSKRATIPGVRLPPSRAPTFKQSEFNIKDLINAMTNTQHRTIASICKASYKE